MVHSNTNFVHINAIGKACPLPLLMLKRALKTLPNSHKILLKASDPHSEIDILRYCKLHHLFCEVIKISQDEFQYEISFTLNSI